MLSLPDFGDPVSLRHCADEAMRHAVAAEDLLTKQVLLHLADAYLEIADALEARGAACRAPDPDDGGDASGENDSV